MPRLSPQSLLLFTTLQPSSRAELVNPTRGIKRSALPRMQSGREHPSRGRALINSRCCGPILKENRELAASAGLKENTKQRLSLKTRPRDDFGRFADGICTERGKILRNTRGFATDLHSILCSGRFFYMVIHTDCVYCCVMPYGHKRCNTRV